MLQAAVGDKRVAVATARREVSEEPDAALLDARTLQVTRHTVQDHGQLRQDQRAVGGGVSKQLRNVEDELQRLGVGAAVQPGCQLRHHVLVVASRGGLRGRRRLEARSAVH